MKPRPADCLCRRCSPHTVVLLLISTAFVLLPVPAVRAAATGAGDSPPSSRSYISPEDGWLDLSGFMAKPYGFLPIVSPITEPAVGYGLWGGPAFVSKPKGRENAGFGRPNITFVGGAWTENDTWGLFAQDEREWLDDRLQTSFLATYSSVNLEFHGIGDDAVLRDHPINYNLEPAGGVIRGRYRFGQTCFWAGIGYAWLDTKSTIDIPDELALEDFHRESRVGGVLPLLLYDSRDNVFTPMGGTSIELSSGLFARALGGSGDFQNLTLTVIQYVSPLPILTFGLRGDGMLSFNDVPFYVLPAVSNRGAPAMRYQGKEVAQGEAEARWQCWRRFSLMGFGGFGAAWTHLERLEDLVTVWTGGTGFRYELARDYGVHAGMDFAWSADGFALYVQFGNAWMWK